jgi:hypothetical protein
MNGSALYYPNIDVRDLAWLRSALLYCDDIYTIVPWAIETPYETEDTKICAKEGQLRPLYCDDYPEVIKRLSERAIELVKQLGSPLPITMQIGTAEPSLKELMEAYRSPTRARLHPDKLGRSRLHPGKVSDELRYLFEQAEHGSLQWLLVNAAFSDSILYSSKLFPRCQKVSGAVLWSLTIAVCQFVVVTIRTCTEMSLTQPVCRELCGICSLGMAVRPKRVRLVSRWRTSLSTSSTLS